MIIKRLFLASVFTLTLFFATLAQQVVLQPMKSVMAPRGEGVVSTSGLSCMGAFLLADLYVGQVPESELVSRYSLQRVDGKVYVPAFLEVEETSVTDKFGIYGVRVNGDNGNMMSAMIPLENFVAFAQSGLCLQIDVAKKMELDNERATRMMRSDDANRGHMLPEKYDGTGVIVGIIDIGFEYGHPTFYDTTGTRYRVKCVWDQNMQCNTHPAGYSYGKEFLTQSSILNAVCSHTNETHGSHVAGIAAGCGGPMAEARQYRGVAPNADLVLVATNMMSTGIYDGINYIKNYASSLGKPCVINMSLGSQVGPHDGTTLFDQMCDNYVGNTPGVLLCASAGNEGSSTLHLSKTFVDATADTSVASILSFSGSSGGSSYVDCWGMPGDTFFVQLGIVDVSTGVFEDVSYLYPSAYSTTYNATMTDSEGHSCSLTLYVTNADPSNGRPDILVRVENGFLPNPSHRVVVRLVGHNTTVHCWANSADLVSGGLSGLVTGDNAYTTGEIGIGRTMITVGSCMSRRNWTALNGTTYGFSEQEGDLSYFSSHGPTLDGRMKPDIVGPGQMLYSAVNKYDVDYCDPTGPWVVGQVTFNGNTEYYAAMQGTSMSCPAVTGCMALWLQANPQMTSAQAHQLLHNSGLQDVYTGVIPSTGSTAWGWGKINLYAGLPVTDDTVINTNCQVDVFPYSDDFELKNGCWTASDNETDGTSWSYFDQWEPGTVQNHIGNSALVSRASTTGTDHVLMSPVIMMPSEGDNWSFAWYEGTLALDGNSYEPYSVYVEHDGQSDLLFQGAVWHQETPVCRGICLDAYRGEEIRIKIVHYAGPSIYTGDISVGLTIDYVSIRQEVVAPQVRIKYNGTTEGNIYVQPGEVMNFEAVILNQARVDDYSWTMGNGHWDSDGARLENVVFDGDMETWVHVFVSNSAGNDLGIRRIYVGNVGVDPVEMPLMSLYPNPSSGLVKVDMGDEEILGIEVLDELGCIVDVVRGSSIDLSNLRSGVYLVRVTTHSGTAVSRVVRL